MANYNAPVVENQPLTMNYTGTVDTIRFLKDGLYQFKVYGAGGGNCRWYNVNSNWENTSVASSGSGGAGGYSIGYSFREKDSVLYACIGGAGGYTGGNSIVQDVGKGGFNGGGNGCSDGDEGGGAGGGASHIATRSGTLSQLKNTSGLLIVAGGGGGGAAGVDYDKNGGNGGAGGGTTGGYGTYKGYDPIKYKYGEPGTQSTGFAFGQGNSGSISRMWSGCGSGLYGGNNVNSGVGGYGGPGGSGYIGGVPAITYKGVQYAPSTKQGGRGAQQHGLIIVTLIKKGTPLMFWSDTEVDEFYYGDKDVDSLFYGDKEVG